MSAHDFHVEHRVGAPPGVLTDAVSVSVYVVLVTAAGADGAAAYGSAGSPVALTRTSLGVYDHTSADLFSPGLHRSKYTLTRVGGAVVSWTEDWDSGQPSGLASLAPLAFAYRRLGVSPTELVQEQIDELGRMLEGYTSAIEHACGRPLLRRAGETIYVSPGDIDPMPGPLALERAWPIESVASVHLDTAAGDPFDVVHDATTLLDAGDYRVWAPAGGAATPAPWGILFRPGKRPDDAAVARAMKVVLTFGYTPHSGGSGYSTPPGQFAALAPLVEALLRQVSIAWKRKEEPHLKSKAQTVAGGGVGTTSFLSSRLARSVRELIAPYATADAACGLTLSDPLEEDA